LKPIRYIDVAEAELLAEIAYLEDSRPGLGRRFYDEVKRAEGFIAEFPEAAEEIRPGIRKRPLRVFRCSLIYAIEADQLLIIAVAHQSRRPGYWVDRIQL
jgi:plasmid stabilization system protein ParE